MVSDEPARIVIVAGGVEEPGMLAAEICKESVQLVGVMVESRAYRRRPDAVRPPLWTRLQMNFQLMLRVPALYRRRIGNRLRRLLGLQPVSFYRSLSRKEAALLETIVKRTGQEYRALIFRNRSFPMLDEVAEAHGVPLLSVTSLNEESAIAALKEMRPDIIVGLGTGILSSAVLDIPSRGILNGHSSLLPDYRGGTTEFWQLVHKEKRTGVTIHWMADEVDAGEIVARESWPISNGMDHHSLRQLSVYARPALWRKAIRSVLNEEPAEAQGPARTPTFRHPSMAQLYAHYVEKAPPEDVVARAKR